MKKRWVVFGIVALGVALPVCLGSRVRQSLTRQRVRGEAWLKHFFTSLQSPKQAFSRIYETNVWGGETGEYYSGLGSESEYAEPYVKAVASMMREQRLSRVVDMGCGDFQVGRRLCDAVPGIDYVGIDIVPALIERNQREFGAENVRFLAQSIEGDGDLPAGDVCLIRQVLQHMSNAEISRTLAAVTARYPLLVITEHQPPRHKARRPNINLGHGYGNRSMVNSAVRVDQPPFSLPDVEVLLEVPFLDDGEYLQTVLVKIRAAGGLRGE